MSCSPRALLSCLAALAVFVLPGTAHAGCEKDTDCKGDRICDSEGRCVAPGDAASGDAGSAGREEPAVSAGELAVTVTTHSSLDKKARERFDEVGAADRLRRQLKQAIDGSSKAGALAGAEVRVAVVDFRLRTKGQIVMTGNMSGSDLIGASVTVIRSGSAGSSFPVASARLSGAGTPDEAKRLDKMLREIVAKTLEGL